VLVVGELPKRMSSKSLRMKELVSHALYVPLLDSCCYEIQTHTNIALMRAVVHIVIFQTQLANPRRPEQQGSRDGYAAMLVKSKKFCSEMTTMESVDH
jgi:hypothetical protein